MKARACLLALAVLLCLGGCDLWYSIFGSSDALITGFSVERLLGPVNIDMANHKVSATVEPMSPAELEALAPTVTISDYAVLTKQALKDGETVIYTVKAQNGTSVDWQVTVTVAYGIAFKVAGTRVVMMHGYVDSSPTYTAGEIGNGQPVGYIIFNYGRTYLDAFPLDQQVGSPQAYTYLQFDGSGTGAHTFADSNATFDYWDGASLPLLNTGSDLEIDVTSYGAAGESIKGTFTCTASDGTNTYYVTDGFFKVLRVEDDPSWSNNVYVPPS
jgi:hypothetical protein